jgi:uncharacterized protein (DUF983 family)
MLRLWSSQTPFVAGLVEHECPRCHRGVELPLGQLCKTCLTNIDKRARKAARIVATLSTLAVGLYIFTPVPTDERVRIVGLVGVLIWYILSNIVVRRVMGQWQR